MSILHPAVKCLFLLLLSTCSALASQVEAPKVRVVLGGTETASVKVEGHFRKPTRAFSFLDSRAGFGGLSKRITNLRTYDGNGSVVPNRRTAVGAVFADVPLAWYSYVADLSPQSDVTLGAHVSWIADGKGMLMLADLLPNVVSQTGAVRLTLELPEGVTAVSNESNLPEGAYAVEAPSDAVFLIAPHIRRLEAKAKGSILNLAIEDDWQFSDTLALKMSKDIFRLYEDVFDATPAKRVQILLVRAPDEAMRDRWRAETRGSTVVIVSSPSTYRNLGVQRFHEQLRHELLHLWIPNSLKLNGEYAWFYEGFVFYRALIAGMDLGQIRFRDVLGTLADAKRRSDRAGEWKALAGLEGDRWTGSTVYSRGTLAAFAADVSMIAGSRGKKDLDDVLKRVYRRAVRSDENPTANEFLIRGLSEWNELRGLVNDSIRGDSAPDWRRALELAGLSEMEGGRLAAVEDPRSSQKAVLRRLGYNGGR
ncbi:MAG TPA: hypothetical protein VMM38_06110 [Aridibacter sp.]|nr:hypothetical protein [Aridibacter sp.]